MSNDGWYGLYVAWSITLVMGSDYHNIFLQTSLLYMNCWNINKITLKVIIVINTEAKQRCISSILLNIQFIISRAA